MKPPSTRRIVTSILAASVAIGVSLISPVALAASALAPDPIAGSVPPGITSIGVTDGKAQGSGLWGWVGDLKTRPYSTGDKPLVFTYGVAASPLDNSVWVTDSGKFVDGLNPQYASLQCALYGGVLLTPSVCYAGDSQVLNYKLQDLDFSQGQYLGGGEYAATPSLASGKNAGIGANFQSYAEATKLDGSTLPGGQFIGARGITVGSDGAAWVMDPQATMPQLYGITSLANGSHGVRVINSDFTEGNSLGAYLGGSTDVWAQRHAPNAFGYAIGVAYLENGHYVTTDQIPELLKEFTADGTFVRNIYLNTGNGYRSPHAIAADPTTPENDVLVGYTDPGSGALSFIERINLDACKEPVAVDSPAGSYRQTCTVMNKIGQGVLGSGNGNNSTSYALTFAIAVDPANGDIYVSQRDQNPYVFTKDGTYRGRFPSFGFGSGSETSPVLKDGQIRVVRGISFDKNGFAYTSLAQGTPSTKVAIFARTPDPVTGLTGVYTSAAKTEATLHWTAPVKTPGDGQAPLRDYVIERSSDGGLTWAKVAATANTTASIAGLDAATTYQFRVSAWNEAGNSDVVSTGLNDSTPASSTLSLVKTGNNQEVSQPSDAVQVDADSAVTFNYTLKNVGTRPITAITLIDDKNVPIDLGTWDRTLAPGASRTFTAMGVVPAGLYHNIATATGVSDGVNLEASDEWWGYGVTRGIAVVKTGAGVIAPNETDRVNVPADTDVVFNYTVTNTGNQAVTGLDLDDSVLGSVSTVSAPSDFTGTLLPGATVTFTKTGHVGQGNYSNTISVSGVSAGKSVAAQSSWYGFGVTTGLAIAKTGNGIATSSPDNAVVVPAGKNVLFTYVVTNVGNTPVSNLNVVDDKIAQLSPEPGFSGVLAPGASARFTATGPVAEGPYTNRATATGDVAGQPVNATADWYGRGVVPAISIVKTGNGHTATDANNAVKVAAGSAVIFTYEVTNNGELPISDIHLVDDKVGNITEVVSPVGFTGTLAPGATAVFRGTGVVAAGPYTNGVHVEGSSDGGIVEASDQWFGYGLTSSLAVVKTGNGIANSSSADELVVPADSSVDFEYVVTNTSNSDVVIASDGVQDSVLGTIPWPQGFTGRIGPGESVAFAAKGTIPAGHYHNSVTVSASNAWIAGDPVTVSDEWFGFGYTAGLSVTKTGAHTVADTADRAVRVKAGSTVDFAYEITNNGNTPAKVTGVVDDKIGTIAPPATFSGILDPGESVTYTATAVIPLGAYVNHVEVFGEAAGHTLTASHVWYGTAIQPDPGIPPNAGGPQTPNNPTGPEGPNVLGTGPSTGSGNELPKAGAVLASLAGIAGGAILLGALALFVGSIKRKEES